MTREKEIEKEAYRQEELVNMDAESFIEGAQWADSNPKSPWISVNEKLPPVEKNNFSIKVIVVSTKGKIDFSRYDYDMEGWISPILDMVFTHWMPIPELPK